MKFNLSDDRMVLIAGVVAVLAAVSSLVLPASPITFALMIPFVFFLPGYALSRLIFDRDLEIDIFLLVSIGMSVVASMLIALLLAISPAKLTQQSVLVSLLGLTIVSLMLDRLVHHENRKYEVEIVMPKREDIDPVVAVAIAFGLVLIGIFGYIILTTHPPSTTNVYLLSESGTDQMPNATVAGGQVNFTIVLHNGEGKSADFLVQIYIDTNMTSSGFSATMDDNATSNHAVKITMPTTAGHYMVKTMVYIDQKYYGELHFWVNVL